MKKLLFLSFLLFCFGLTIQAQKASKIKVEHSKETLDYDKNNPKPMVK